MIRYVSLLKSTSGCSVILFFFLLSCTSNNESEKKLSQADSLMDSKPDSALTLLESISNPERLSGSEQAEYALLFTQAQDKNYIIPINDSLIQIAVDYYKDRGDKMRATQSYFYLGSVYRDMENTTLAIEAFLKGEFIMPVDNHKSNIKGMIYENLSQSYEKHRFYEKAQDATRQAYQFYKEKKDSSRMANQLRRIGHLFLYEDQQDSVLHYYQLSLEMAQAVSDSSLIPIILDGFAHIYCDKKEYLKALSYLTEATKSTSEEASDMSYLKGKILLQLNKPDSARYYLLQSKNNENIYTQAISYMSLYELEKTFGSLQKAIFYNDSSLILRDSISVQERQDEVRALINKHEIQLHTNELTIEQKKREIKIILISSGALCTFIYIFMVFGIRQRKKIIELQKALINDQVNSFITPLEPDGLSELDSDVPIIKWQQKEQCDKNRRACVQVFKDKEEYNDLIRLIQDVETKDRSIPSQERKKIQQSLHYVFFNVITDLKEMYNLTSDDTYLCILSSFNFSNKAIAAVMGVTPGAIKSRKSRIKEKTDSKYFSRIFPDKPF